MTYTLMIGRKATTYITYPQLCTNFNTLITGNNEPRCWRGLADMLSWDVYSQVLMISNNITPDRHRVTVKIYPGHGHCEILIDGTEYAREPYIWNDVHTFITHFVVFVLEHIKLYVQGRHS